ncbi:ABC transporter substrate-binding protein [Prochlorococcus sp. MIT 1341]|uniref:ABC transporter substrate-binding protein n=1 Tax=Prochlorococcus sp. MIT 1341 TaxID=3096221 RepID=UPI002A751DC3|nr:ABC transporter substrate-binding protein [Prochlorococcus sp. MIT 1341]
MSSFIAYFLLLINLFLFSSCKPDKVNSRIVVASAGKITSLDPAQASTFDVLQLLSGLGDTLYKFDQNGSLIPRLASELPIFSDLGKTITIPLRKDIYFHDGTPFNSYAMAFTFRRFMRIGRLNYLIGGRISSIETPSPYLIRLRLTRASSSIEGLLTSINLTPVSPTAYSDHQNKFLNDRFIGTGPYKLTRFNRQQQRLDPFHLYWGKPAQNKGIDFIKLSNSTALFGAMKSGEIDVLLSNALDEDQHLALHKMSLNGNLREGLGRALEIGYITFRSNIEPLSNPIIRTALSYSLDRKLIVDRVSYGLRKPLRSLLPPTLKSIEDSPWPSYNPVKAYSLFKSVGYCDDKKLTIPFTFRSNVPADKLLALTWKEQIDRDLSDCLKLTLQGVESITVYKQLGQGAFDAVMLDWRGSYPGIEAYLTPLLSCSKFRDSYCEEGEAAISGSFWSSFGLEESLQLSDKTVGDQRKELLNSVERMAAKGGAYLPVWLVTPKAWAQSRLAVPEFDGSGQLLLERLREH